MLLLPAHVLLPVFHADDKVAVIGGIRDRHAGVLRLFTVNEHAVILGELPPVFKLGNQVVPVQEQLHPFPVLGINQPVRVCSGDGEEIVALVLHPEFAGFPLGGKLRVIGGFAVDIIDQIVVGGQPLGDLRIGNALFLIRFQGKLRLRLRVNVLNADDEMLPVPGHDSRKPDVPDLALHHQAVGGGERIPFFQLVQHHVLIMQVEGFLLVLGVHKLADASPALGEKVIAGGGHVELLIIVGGGNLAVGVGGDIDIVQRVKLFGQAAGDLVVKLFLPFDFFFQLSLPVFRVNIFYAQHKIILCAVQAANQPQGMPCGRPVDHQAVFDALHHALLHGVQKLFFLNVLNEDVLILFIDHLFAVPDDVFEKVIAPLLQIEGMKLRVHGIPVVFICHRVHIVDAAVIHQQRFRDFHKNLFLYRHKPPHETSNGVRLNVLLHSSHLTIFFSQFLPQK